jgi:WD40 repeat protein
VAHCLAVGPNDTVWSCSENSGLLQLWSTKTQTLTQSWEVDCGGLNHIAFSRGHAWVAGADGSLYIWDAELLLPIIEIKAHVASVRAIAVIRRECVWPKYLSFLALLDHGLCGCNQIKHKRSLLT